MPRIIRLLTYTFRVLSLWPFRLYLLWSLFH